MMREQRRMQTRQIRTRIWRILAVLVPSIFGYFLFVCLMGKEEWVVDEEELIK